MVALWDDYFFPSPSSFYGTATSRPATITVSDPASLIRTLSGPVTDLFGSRHIYYLLEAGSWTNAQATARSLGGHLATINDAREQEWLMKMFGDLGDGQLRGFWIGLNDRGEEGVFRWISGETSSIGNWRPGEPNNSPEEDYVHIYPVSHGYPSNFAGFWNDRRDVASGGNARPFTLHGIVEIDPDDSNTPSVKNPSVPELLIHYQDSKQLQIVWPQGYPESRLERSFDMAPGSWETILTITNEAGEWTDPSENKAGYFRLVR